MKKILLLWVVGLSAACPKPVTLDPQDPEVLAAFDRIESLLAKVDVPGLSAVIVYDQEMIWNQGFGYANSETRVRASLDTVYRVGRLTELITGTMLMQLQQAGKCDLDDPVTDFMSSYTVPNCEGKPSAPTLRQMASQLAGLPPYKGENSAVDILKSLDDVQAIAPIGTSYNYSVLSYVVLGHVCSLIAKTPYDQYVNENIFTPLGMKKSAFVATPELQPQLAAGQVKVAPGLAAAVGLLTTARDMAKFISLQFNQEPIGVLSRASLTEMHAPTYIFPNWEKAVAIGWMLKQQGKWTMLIQSDDQSEVAIIPSLKIGVILFANGKFKSVAGDILEILSEAKRPTQSKVTS